MTKKTNQSKTLLEASQRVLELAAKRRERMAQVKADEEDLFNAPLPELPAEEATEEPALETAPEVTEPVADPAAEAAPEPAPEPVAVAPEAAPAPAAEAAPAIAPEPIAPAAPAAPGLPAAASAEAEVNAADSQPPNGGFEGHSLANAPDNADLGEEEYGMHVPPELKQKVEDGKAEDPSDESYQPGVLVPPGLEDAVMAFVDPNTLSANEAVDFVMLPMMPEGATTAAEVLNAGAHWILCANGDPLAKISLSDQDDADKIAAHFVNLDYAKSVIEGIGKHGLKATLDFVKAKPYVAKVDENAKIAEVTARLETEAAEKLRAAVADTKSKYVENIALVLQADAANFLPPNALKNGLVAWAMSAGVPEAAAVEGIDSQFFQYGEKGLSSILDQAEVYANFTPEALEQIKASIDQTGRRARALPSQLSPAESNPDYDQGLANRMAANAVPLQQPAADANTSVAAANVGNPEPASEDAKAAFRTQFGRFGS